MINVKYYKPDRHLSWLVSQFETIKTHEALELEDKFVPRTDVAFVFHFKSLPQLITPVKTELQPFFIAPIIGKANAIKVCGALDTFIVNCKPSVLSRLYHLNMLPDAFLNIDLPYAVFYPLWSKLKKCNTTEKRIEVFSEFIGQKINTPYLPDDIDIVYTRIVENSLSSHLSEIFKESQLSISSIQRNFIQRVGVSPKFLARLMRINYLWDVIQNNKTLSCQDLVFFGNYFDQPHFIKDFKEITGETPNYFFKRNLDLCKILSGKETT